LDNLPDNLDEALGKKLDKNISISNKSLKTDNEGNIVTLESNNTSNIITLSP
jgi:hypothetical protein